MWSKLHVPWGSHSRTPSPTNAQQQTSDPESISVTTSSEGIAPMTEGAGLELCEPRHLDTYQGEISLMQFSHDGNHLVICGIDGTFRRWKVWDGDDRVVETWQMVHSEGQTRPVVFSKDGRWMILIGIGGRRVTVWDATTHAKVVESIEAHEQKITALDVSLDGLKIASGSEDGRVIVWCLHSGQRLAGPYKEAQAVSSVCFSPLGDRLASSGWGHSIHVWDVRSDRDQSITCLPTDPAFSLAWSSDGRGLFAGCYRGSILHFDVTSSLSMSKWPDRPHFDSISILCLSNNGEFIISACRSECSIKIWDSHTYFEIGSLGHSSEVTNAAISPDDGHLVSGTKDGQISIWNLQKFLPMSYFFHSLVTFPTLSSCSASYAVLTNVSNVAYLSWRKAESVGTEKILSSEIENGSGPLHYHLANRALIKTRLRQWDQALEDAQASLRVKPSLVALLAKSVAQSGQELYSAAIETLNLIPEICAREERDFAGAIKVITLFHAGFYEDAMRHANDLVVRSPGVKRPCAFVKAKMYVLAATGAMNNQEYVRAITLLAQGRDLCPSGHCPELDSISLISGWVFDDLRLTIYRQLCEACYAARRTQETLDNLAELERIFRDEIKLRNELSGWVIDFKSRCVEMLETQGDGALHSNDYSSAIAKYTAAMVINPGPSLSQTLFMKRSEARIALCLWEEALKDADEAIGLNPSSHGGYERKHAALHNLKRYEEATDTLKTMISVLENSPDSDIRRLRDNYVDPSDTENAVLGVFKDCLLNTPFRLIDTKSGLLCDGEIRERIFREDPIFQELVSSMTTRLHRERIDMVTRQYFQYVMLSHRWEAKELELADVLDKSIYTLDDSLSATKLQQFCRLACDAQFRWAWSDTCCINKDKDVEFEKSINSMFNWYRSSAATFVYLTGVPPRLIPGALKRSVWMTRGWTLQELLAPPVIRFYYESWTPYLDNQSLNHKESADIMKELEEATRVTAHDLLAFRPGPENIRVKLRLASTRETTVPVDMAYGLFGIFGLTMPVIHGESQEHALGRLFQEIVARSGDVACLSWVGRSSEFNSAFPDHIKVYQNAFHTITHVGKEDMEKQVVELRYAWTHEEELGTMAFYQRLCALPPARCANQHLHLPCIVFPLTMLRKVKQADRVRVYSATTDMLEDTEIRTDERFLPRSQIPGNLILVCPWIDELLDVSSLRHGRDNHHPTDDADPNSDSDSELESESEHEFPPQEATSVELLETDAPLSHRPTQTDGELKALRLAVRFRQSLGALLLLAQGHGQYRRVATDHDITIRVRNGASLGDMVLNTLEIL